MHSPLQLLEQDEQDDDFEVPLQVELQLLSQLPLQVDEQYEHDDEDFEVPLQVESQLLSQPPLQVDEQYVHDDEDFEVPLQVESQLPSQSPSHPPRQEYEQLVLQPPLQVLLQPLHPKASSNSSSSFSQDNKLGPIMTMPNIGKDFLIAFLKKALLLYKSSIVHNLK